MPWIGRLHAGTATEAPRGGATAGVIEFLDGSVLHGRLRSMNPERGVGWEHPEAKQLIEFRPGNLASILFEGAKPISTELRPTCRFRFHNGDELFGHLTAIDAEHVEMETWFGGNLRAPRDAVQSISFFWRGFAVLFEGPTGPDGWSFTKSSRGWQYRDGGFVTSEPGIVGRDLKLPAASIFEFDLAWNSPFTLGLTLYAETVDRFDYSTSSYMFYISPGQVSLQRMQSGVGVASLGRAEIPWMPRQNKVHLEFRINKEEATLSLLADGRLVHRWRDSVGFVAKGSGVVFSSQMEGPQLRVSNIRAAEWDGRFETDRATNAPPAADFVTFANRDRVSGQLKSVSDGKLVFAAAQTPLEIPMQRVSQIVLGRTNAPMAKTSPWEVRAHVSGGGTVAFRLDRWERERVSGTSATFGQLALNPQSIRQLQFNLNRPRSADGGQEASDDLDKDDE